MKRLAVVALVVLLFGGAGLPQAQAPAAGTLPTGEAVLTKYIEATGGVAAYQAIKNRVLKLKIEILGTGVTIMATVYQARPDRTYALAEADAIGRIETGVTDGVAWEKSDLRGALIKEGQERDDALRDAQFDRLVNFRTLHKKIECLGLETVEGKQCYKVVLTPNVGSPQTVYYDRDSGLTVRSESMLATAAGTFSVVSVPSDYRQVADGIRIAFTNTVTVAGQTRVNTIERVEQNVDVPADRFALPAEIKALLAAKK